MKFLKDITIHDDTIHIQFIKGCHVNEFQMQMMNKNPNFITMNKEKRAKTQIFYDVKNLCSLQTYLRSTSLTKEACLKLFIDVLEKINSLQKDYYLYLSLETICFREDGTLCLVAFPVSKESYEEVNEDVHKLLVAFLQEVQVQHAAMLLGIVVEHLKCTPFRMLALLQDLHQQQPLANELPFWKRFFFKEETVLVDDYPKPSLKPIYQQRDDYIEEIEEESNETQLLFKDTTKSGYLKNGKIQVSITNQEFLIGRNPDSDCYLNAPSISKQHALIVQEKAAFYIKDLKSMNATFVNGKKLEPHKLYDLHNNDEITLGETTLNFYES